MYFKDLLQGPINPLSEGMIPWTTSYKLFKAHMTLNIHSFLILIFWLFKYVPGCLWRGKPYSYHLRQPVCTTSSGHHENYHNYILGSVQSANICNRICELQVLKETAFQCLQLQRAGHCLFLDESCGQSCRKQSREKCFSSVEMWLLLGGPAPAWKVGDQWNTIP